MAEVKIKTHTTYTYETSDGREFEMLRKLRSGRRPLEN